MTCTLFLRSAWILRYSIHRRPYSNLARTRDAFVRQCLFTLHKQTREPLWRVLAVLGHPRVGEVVGRAPIPEAYRRLALALSPTSTTTSDDTHDTPSVEHTLSSLNLPANQLDTLKTWIHLYTLFRHHSHSPASTLTHIVDPLFASLERLPTHHQAPLLIFGAAHLSSWNLVLPLERVVEEFVSLPHPIETPIYTSKRGHRSLPPTSDTSPKETEEAESPLQTKEESRRLLLTLPDTPTRPTSELYFNLFLRALALTPKYSTAYDRYLRRILHRMDTLPRPTVKRPLVTASSTEDRNEVALVDPDSNALAKRGRKEEETVQLPYTLHPDTYTCLLLSTYNALAPPGRVPHQASLLSPPLATYLASRLLNEPGAFPFPAPHVRSGHVENGVMQDVHREALLRFWAKQAKEGGARGVRGQENARELWMEIQRKDGRVPVDVQDTLRFGSSSSHGIEEGGKSTKAGKLVVAEGVVEPTGKGKEIETDPVLRANTLHLGSQPSIRGVRELLAIFNTPSPRQPRHETVGVPAPIPSPRRQLKAKPALDIYDLTSTLSSAANDLSVSIPVFKVTFRKLMRVYKASSSSNMTDEGSGASEKKPAKKKAVPLAAHTAYLRGLYWRGAFGDARAWWEGKVWGRSVWAPAPAPTTSTPHKGGRIVGERYILDKKAITIGVQVLARCGQAKEAIEVLERVAWRPGAQPPRPTPSTAPHAFFASTSPSPIASSLASRNAPPPPLGSKPVSLSPISLLDIFVAFKRACRPDIVFKLWDHMYTLYGVVPTHEGLNVLLQAARMAVIMEGKSLKAQVRGAINMGRERLRIGGGGKGATGQGAEGEKVREKAVEDVMDVARRAEYEGGRLWKGKRVEDAAREVFLQCLFGMEAGYGHGRGLFEGGRKGKVGLANIVAPACAVRSDWDSDAGVVGLGVGLPELRLRRFEYKPGREMFAWVPSPSFSASRTPASNSSAHPTVPRNKHEQQEATLVPRPLYPTISLTNSNFLSYLSLLAVTRRTSEVALTLAWMREIGINPSESVLALGMVLWEEVSVEGPLVDLVVTKLSSRAQRKRNGSAEGKGDNEVEKPEPRDECERLVFWIGDWVGEERLPGIEALRKWRGVVRDMREPGARAALVKQRKTLDDE